MVQCRPVFACGSSIVGTVSFLEEEEFNEVMMVPSSDQLTVGKVGPATSIHCLFFMKAIVSTVTRRSVKHGSPVNLACAPLPPSSCNAQVTDFSHFLSNYFLSNVFTFLFKTQLFFMPFLELFFYT